MRITIRAERTADTEAIASLTEAAFKDIPYSSHTEQHIVSALRRCNQLTVSLVALDYGVVVGHVAISPVTISSGASGWYGLGPISVLPKRQRRGIGSKLMRAAIAQLQRAGAAGCVVLGDPSYYGQFGFKNQDALELPGVPREYFQALLFAGEIPSGRVGYHEAFEAT
jgi:putative acetyltransferase